MINTDNAFLVFQSLCKDARKDYLLFCELISNKYQQQFHQEWQKTITENKKIIIKAARGHGKTTQILWRLAWEIGNNPNVRIKIFSANDAEAIKKGNGLRAILESDVYKLIFPEIQPSNIWNITGFTVERNDILVDPTCESKGILAVRAGGRADIIVLDDVCDLKNSLSGAQRLKVKEQFYTIILPMLNPINGKIIVLFTPYHKDDLSANLELDKDFTVISSTIKIENGEIIPLWEQMCNKNFLEAEQKRNSISFSRSYLCVCANASDFVIKSDWFRSYEFVDTSGATVYAGMDCAYRKGEDNDYTALVAVVRVENKYYIRECLQRKMTFAESLKITADFCQRNKVNTISIEGGREDEHGVSFISRLREVIGNTHIQTEHPTKDKMSRLQEVSALFENGSVLFNLNLKDNQSELYTELFGFPYEPHDDTVDALVYALRLCVNNSISNNDIIINSVAENRLKDLLW